MYWAGRVRSHTHPTQEKYHAITVRVSPEDRRLYRTADLSGPVTRRGDCGLSFGFMAIEQSAPPHVTAGSIGYMAVQAGQGRAAIQAVHPLDHHRTDGQAEQTSHYSADHNSSAGRRRRGRTAERIRSLAGWTTKMVADYDARKRKIESAGHRHHNA